MRRQRRGFFENQTELDAAILNADDAASAKYAPKRPQVFWFSRKKHVAQERA